MGEIVRPISSVEVKLLARVADIAMKPDRVVATALAKLFCVAHQIPGDTTVLIVSIDRDLPEIRTVVSLDDDVADDEVVDKRGDRISLGDPNF